MWISKLTCGGRLIVFSLCWLIVSRLASIKIVFPGELCIMPCKRCGASAGSSPLIAGSHCHTPLVAAGWVVPSAAPWSSSVQHLHRLCSNLRSQGQLQSRSSAVIWRWCVQMATGLHGVQCLCDCDERVDEWFAYLKCCQESKCTNGYRWLLMTIDDYRWLSEKCWHSTLCIRRCLHLIRSWGGISYLLTLFCCYGNCSLPIKVRIIE